MSYTPTQFQMLQSGGLSHGLVVLECLKQIFNPHDHIMIETATASHGDLHGFVVTGNLQERVSRDLSELGTRTGAPFDTVWTKRAVWIWGVDRYSTGFSVMLLEENQWANEYNPDTWPQPAFGINGTVFEYYSKDYYRAAEIIYDFFRTGKRPSN